MACCEKFNKYFLMVINVLFLVFGLFLIGTGLLLHTPNSNNIHWLAVGLSTSALSFVGFWGAYKEKPVLLKMYAWILLICLCIKVAYMIFNQIRHEQQRTEYEKMFQQYGLNKESTLSVDVIQQSYRCCGFDEPHAMMFHNGTYPWSCCVAEEDVPCIEPTYFVGCAFMLFDSLSSTIRYLVGYISIGIHISCAFIAFRLSSAIQRRNEPPKFTY